MRCICFGFLFVCFVVVFWRVGSRDVVSDSKVSERERVREGE